MNNLEKKYKNPPVVEALCEVFFNDSQWDSTIPGIFFEKVKDKYPQKKELKTIEFGLELSKNALSSKFTSRNSRLQFVRNDNSGLIQIEKDLIVVNQLKPYSSFEDWKPVIYGVLNLYADFAKPKEIKNFGLRYINKIVIPFNSFEMEDYFELYPNCPKTWQMMGKFAIRLELTPKHKEHLVFVTFAAAPLEKPDTYPIMLDIYDIFQSKNLLLDNISVHIDEAHENIVETFETIIKEKTRELFEEKK